MQARQAAAAALRSIIADLGLSWPEKLVIEEPRNAEFGDLSTNAAMALAKEARQKPRELAEVLARKLKESCPEIRNVEVAGQGFCNITFMPAFWQEIARDVEQQQGAYGNSDSGAGITAQVEYVSANPTGPLHVGHGRGAAVGDSIARLLRAAGYDVQTEYYLNDAGRQMRILGLSIWLRCRELSGKNIAFPPDCYKGEYIRAIAAEVLKRHPDLLKMDERKAREICQEFGMNELLSGIKTDLEEFRCEHEKFFSERSLVETGAVDRAFKALKDAGRSYEKDGALWFETSALGDDQDRVLRKSDGSLTYFASDIAYHHNKFQRGINWSIDIWGADHHGYIPRMKAAVQAMGEDPANLSIVLVQLVNLLRDGEAVSMSTRSGEFVTLADVIQEVGTDAARFMFLSRSSDSPLDFDLELAKRRSLENPVYYVQYAHARIAGLMRRARDHGLNLPEKSDPAILSMLDREEDLALLRRIGSFPDVTADSAKALAPHHVSRYLMDLAGLVHSYYANNPVIQAPDEKIALARLALMRAAAQTIRNGLFLLGVSAPEMM